MGYTFDTSISVNLKYITFFLILQFNFNIYAVISFGYFSILVFLLYIYYIYRYVCMYVYM